MVGVQARSRQGVLQRLQLVLPFRKEMARKECTRAFTSQGFDSWKTALEKGKGLDQHEKSEMHNESCAAHATFIGIEPSIIDTTIKQSKILKQILCLVERVAVRFFESDLYAKLIGHRQRAKTL